LVSQLSGGTQRRLSIAVTFINNPSLVILDEPTVGIDPLLRNHIWDYLVNKCREGLTVVIVTHYIEEAVNANRVGLMRNGRLLAENNPKNLIRKFNENNLEIVFLKLCLLEDKNFYDNKDERYELDINENIVENNETFVNTQYDNNYDIKRKSSYRDWTFNLWILLILVNKNFLKFFHMGFSLFIVLLPAAQVIVFSAVYSKDLIEVWFLKNLILHKINKTKKTFF
jgi:ABC-type multidrug transport system ATPase subunit